MQKKLLAAMLIGGFILAGCGGGGGGASTGSTSTSSTPSATAPTAAITTSNAVQIASTAFNGSSGLSQISSSTATAFKATSGQSVNILSVVSGVLTNQLQSHVYAQPSSPLMRAVKATSNTQQCQASGSVTVMINEAGATWQPGDSISVTANDCQASTSGPVINGSLIMTLGNITQNDPSGFAGSIGLAANNFSAAQGSHYASLNGSFQVSVVVQGANYVASASQVELQTSGFTLSGDAVGTITIDNLDYVDFNNIAQGSWWFTQNSTVNNNGSIFNVQTNQQFAASGCSYPSSGSALLTGLGSSESVTANSDGTTTLQITNNGETTTQKVPSSQVFSLICR